VSGASAVGILIFGLYQTRISTTRSEAEKGSLFLLLVKLHS